MAGQGFEPTWEEFQAQNRQVEKVSDNLREWRHYQVDTLGRARDRMTDEDNPPSKRELDEIMKDIEESAPSRTATKVDKAPEVAASTGVSATPIPTLNS